MKRFTAALVATVVVISGVRAEDRTRSETREPATEKEFVAKAIACANHEIRLAELAKKQTKNADVIKFADTIITDHTAMRDKLNDRAKSMNVAIVEGEKAYGKEQQDQYNHLKTLTNAEFDKTYAKTMVENHEKAIKMAETWSTKATDKDLGTVSTDCVAKLKEHKKMAEDLKAKVG
jgi:putative membrane protein